MKRTLDHYSSATSCAKKKTPTMISSGSVEREEVSVTDSASAIEKTASSSQGVCRSDDFTANSSARNKTYAVSDSEQREEFVVTDGKMTEPTSQDTPSTCVSDCSGRSTSHKDRTFQNSWLQKWPWLRKTLTGMHCELCQKHNKVNTMTSSLCQNYRTSTLERHAVSADHKISVEQESLSKGFNTVSLDIFRFY